MEPQQPYTIEDYCKDSLGLTEDQMIAKIDRDRELGLTPQEGDFRLLINEIRNRYTGRLLREKLNELYGRR